MAKPSGFDVKIVEDEKVAFDEPLMILGFAGTGLVGGIAASHLVDELGLKEVAHIQSRYIPPAVVFYEGKLRYPFRIYSDKRGKLCVVLCEVPLRSSGAYPLASALLDWAEAKGIKELVVLDGAVARGMPEVERKVFCATEPDRLNECEGKGLEMVKTGIIHGITGSILSECLSRKMLGLAFLVPALDFIPDPEGAANLVDAVNRAYGLNVNTDKLVGEAEKIRKKLTEVAQRYEKMSTEEEKRGDGQKTYIS